MAAITQVSVRPDLSSLAKRRRQAKRNDHRPLLAGSCLLRRAEVDPKLPVGAGLPAMETLRYFRQSAVPASRASPLLQSFSGAASGRSLPVATTARAGQWHWKWVVKAMQLHIFVRRCLTSGRGVVVHGVECPRPELPAMHPGGCSSPCPAAACGALQCLSGAPQPRPVVD